jgi:hypothetical protein
MVHKPRLFNLGARKPHLLTALDACRLIVQRLRIMHAKLRVMQPDLVN